MARNELPDPLNKSDLLHSAGPDECTKYAGMFYEKDRYSDALDFYAKAEDREGLLKVKQVAVEEGDYFLLRRLKDIIPEELSEADWEKLGRNAQSKGKTTFAQWADEERGKRGAPGDHEGEE